MNTLRFHFVSLVIGLFLIFNASSLKAQSALDGFDPKPNSLVRIVVVQPDGKILIGGEFTAVSPNGGASVARRGVARFNPDGSLDTTFNPNVNGFSGATVLSIVLQPDGKILIGGTFTTVAPNGGAEFARNKIARLNADGSLDVTFDPNADSTVFSIVLQPDGKILIVGNFHALAPSGGAAVTRNNIARLNNDGSVDMTFDPNADNTIYIMALQPDGKILIGGGFRALSRNGGAPVRRYRVARLNVDGTVDATFDPNVDGTIALNTRDVYGIALQADGKIIIGGTFTSLAPNGGAAVARSNIARLNADGTVDMTFDPNVGNGIPNSSIAVIVAQPDGKIIIGGFFTSLAPNGGATVTRNRIARLHADGSLDAAFNPNVDNSVRSIAVQSDGKIIIGGNFDTLAPNGSATATARSNIARLERDGRADQTLNLTVNGDFVLSTTLQPDGKIIIGGSFFFVLGAARGNIARMNTDGTLDTTFVPNADSIVYAIAMQPDGKILIGGTFSRVFLNSGASTVRFGIARLNADSTVDATFAPHANADVRAIAVQADGKILIAGLFTMLAPNGGAAVVRKYVARLETDGTLDTTFNPNMNDPVTSMAVQPDGKIIIGGNFTALAPNGGATVTRNYIARLNNDGSLDTTFDPNANQPVNAIAAQPDGRILIGGNFTSLAPNGGAAAIRNRIARLNADGTVDTSFNPNASASVSSIVVQSDGKILLGGIFTSLAPNDGATVPRRCFARLHADGTVDMIFDPNVNGFVASIAVQSDGKILVGGSFSSFSPNGGATVARNFFARLANDTPALSSLTVTRSAVILTRDGAAAQFTRVVFELSTNNGANWTMLGTAANSFAPSAPNGTKETGENQSASLAPQAAGYTLSGLNLPTGQNILIRARGFYRTGLTTGSETMEEKVQIAFLPAPTAAQVSVSGRVLNADGSGLRNASVRLTDSNGNTQIVPTGSFGYFRFDSVRAGETYIVSVVAKGYQFAPQVVTVNEELSELNFTAQQ